MHRTLRYMCTFVRTSERDGWRRTKSIFLFLSLSFSPLLLLLLLLRLSFFSFSFSRAKKRKSLKFSLACIHTCIYIALLVALLPIYLLSTAHRPMKFQNRRVKRAEKTTATTIERKKRNGE